MGDDADAKWHRALLKKLRSAVAVKTRVDAGDAASLQKSQAGKGTKRAIDDALRALKQAGLGRDSPLVRAAFEAGAREGTTAMEKAAKRGPDGGADGLTPSKKRLKREARAEAYAEGGGGGEADASGKKASFRSSGLALGASSSKTTTPRNPHVSGHVFAACKRAVYALHALAKEPEREGAAYVFSLQKRFLSATASLSSPASLVAAAADARDSRESRCGRSRRPAGGRSTRSARRSPYRREGESGDGASRPRRLGAVRRRRAPLGRARRGDGGVVRRKPRDGDARVPGPSRRGARRGKGAAQTRRAGGLGQPAGCRQRAVGVRAPARRRRRGGGEATGRRAGGRRERRKNSFDERREPPGDERRAVGARHAPRGRSVSGRRRNGGRGARLRRRRGGARARGLHAAVRRGRGLGVRETASRSAGRRGFGARSRNARLRGVVVGGGGARLGVGRVAVVPAEKPGEHALGVRGGARRPRARGAARGGVLRHRHRRGRAPPPSARGVPSDKKRRSLRNRVARVARSTTRASTRTSTFVTFRSFLRTRSPRRTTSPRRSRRRRSFGCERWTRNKSAPPCRAR